MSRLLHLVWEKDTEGYEIVELNNAEIMEVFESEEEYLEPTSDAEPGEIQEILIRINPDYTEEYRPANLHTERERRLFIRGKGGGPIKYQPLEREPALFKILAETKPTPESACSFANRFGLLSLKSKNLSPWCEWDDRIKFMRHLVEIWEQDSQTPHGKEKDYIRLADIFDQQDHCDLAVKLHYVVGSPVSERPSLMLQPRTLWSGLLLQFAQAITSDAMLRKCNYCGNWFSVGSGTGRRNTAKFCTDRCRIASHRQQKGR